MPSFFEKLLDFSTGHPNALVVAFHRIATDLKTDDLLEIVDNARAPFLDGLGPPCMFRSLACLREIDTIVF